METAGAADPSALGAALLDGADAITDEVTSEGASFFVKVLNGDKGGTAGVTLSLWCEEWCRSINVCQVAGGGRHSTKRTSRVLRNEGVETGMWRCG